MNLAWKRALLSGLVLPGLGQYQNGQKIKGIIYFALVFIVVVGYVSQIGFLFSDYMQSILSLSDPASTVYPKEAVKTFFYGLLKCTAFWGIIGLIVWVSSGIDAHRVAIRKYGNVDESEIKHKE